MLSSDRVQVLSLDGPLTVVRRSDVPTADRARALGAQQASQVISRLWTGGAGNANRHTLCEIHRIVTGGSGFAYVRVAASKMREDVLGAVSRGAILILDGWMMGSAWTPRRFATKGVATVDTDRESTPEVGIARRAMGGRDEEVSFERARYLLLPVWQWRELREQGGYEVVRREEAAAVLARMSARAASTEQRAALGEASKSLADTKKSSSREGLFLVRRSVRESDVAQKSEAPAAMTPSQIAKKLESVENVDPVMDGGTVELDLSEVELPVDSGAAEATEESTEEDASEDAEASEAGGESATPAPSDDSSDGEPQ